MKSAIQPPSAASGRRKKQAMPAQNCGQCMQGRGFNALARVTGTVGAIVHAVPRAREVHARGFGAIADVY
jgi:hypothetical protein